MTLQQSGEVPSLLRVTKCEENTLPDLGARVRAGQIEALGRPRSWQRTSKVGRTTSYAQLFSTSDETSKGTAGFRFVTFWNQRSYGMIVT